MEHLTGQLAVGRLGADTGVGGDVVGLAGVLDPDIVVGLEGALSQGGLDSGHVVVGLAGGVLGILLVGQVVGTQHHILSRHGDRAAVLRTEQVVGGEH